MRKLRQNASHPNNSRGRDERAEGGTGSGINPAPLRIRLDAVLQSAVDVLVPSRVRRDELEVLSGKCSERTLVLARACEFPQHSNHRLGLQPAPANYVAEARIQRALVQDQN